MDKELDDLLDSALDDFDKKLTIDPAQNHSITIEKTNLYVDDIDYDDRPAPKSIFTHAPQTSSQVSKADLDEMKLFEEIFSDEKTKDSMKQFKDVFDMFKQVDPQSGVIDEDNLFKNLEQVMSQLNAVDDDDGDDTEDDFFKKPGQSRSKERFNFSIRCPFKNRNIKAKSIRR